MLKNEINNNVHYLMNNDTHCRTPASKTIIPWEKTILKKKKKLLNECPTYIKDWRTPKPQY